MRWLHVLVPLGVALGTGCAHGSSVAPVASAVPTVVVLAPRLETPIDAEPSALAAALERGLTDEGGLRPQTADPALASDPDCFDRLACLRALGRSAVVDYVAATSITGLGDTAMLRVRLVDVRETGTEQTRQTVVQPADGPALAASLVAIGQALASPLAPPTVVTDARARRRARFRWLGPVLAAGLAGIATGAYFLARPNGGDPDVVIVPP